MHTGSLPSQLSPNPSIVWAYRVCHLRSYIILVAADLQPVPCRSLSNLHGCQYHSPSGLFDGDVGCIIRSSAPDCIGEDKPPSSDRVLTSDCLQFIKAVVLVFIRSPTYNYHGQPMSRRVCSFLAIQFHIRTHAHV